MDSKFWPIFLVFFLFWCVLLRNFNGILVPGLSSVSTTQEDSDSDDDTDLDTGMGADTPYGVDDRDHGKSQDNSDGSDSIRENVNVEKNPENANADHHVENSGNGRDASEEKDAMPDVEDLEKEIDAEKRRNRKPCDGRYIYMHDVPSRFHEDYLTQCRMMNKWQNMCPYFANGGIGEALRNLGRLFTRSSWYDTNQFTLEIIFHSLMKKYECLTEDSSKAAAVFVPYYPGLDVARHLWDGHSNSVKDGDALELFEWLRNKPEWEVMGGRDHFMVAGRITWDFRRETDTNDGWGSKLMRLPEVRNMTVLTIESSPWDNNDFAIPYPTYFHPSRDDQVHNWQRMMRRRKRRTLFCFAGAPRQGMENSIRGEVMRQCTAAPRRRCRMLECMDDTRNCLKPVNVMKMFTTSTFCLQPPGDSFTRRSTFDAIIAGCIPVFFHPGSSYVQYLWHLPKDFASYSVLIPEQDVKSKNVSINGVLSRIPRAKVAAMRAQVIKLIPNVIYTDPRERLDGIDDAFDLALQGVVRRVERLRNDVDEFNPDKSWKYYTFGTTEAHEWDRFFNRSQWT